MTSASVRRTDQRRPLFLSAAAFIVCFAVGTIFAIIGVQIQKNLGLSDAQLGLLVGTPILTGSLIRLILGIWSDQYGGRLVFFVTMVSAAVMTALLALAYDYPTFLLAALGVGISGGSFSVGIAYVAKWFPKGKQGAALGIFGAGNVGAAMTKLAAPTVMVTYGWQAVALVWAAALALIAVVFFVMTKDDPDLEARRLSGQRPESLSAMLEPLKNVQVWRFSLYYFFVFGGFVSLALWLPHYLIGVYGVGIAAAGVIGAAYSIPASIFRAYGGHLADKFGARRAMYWTFMVSTVCTFILSYPPTQYVMQGSHGPIAFSTHLGVVGFMVVASVLGFFMSLGKAAVFKHIPVYYPDRVGAVGGVVGLVGGLGGFAMPIAFGALNDLTGIWQSCFWLLFALVATALVWMHVAVRQMERTAQAAGAAVSTLPELPEMQPVHGPAQQGALAATGAIKDWRPEDAEFWDATGRRIARRNLWISVPCLLLSFAVWMVWSVVVAKLPAVGFAFGNEQLFWLAALPGLSGATLRVIYAFMPAMFGRHGLRRAGPDVALLDIPRSCPAVRPGRRQLRVVDGRHLVLLSQGGAGQCAGHQRGSWQSRRQCRAVRRAAGHHDGRIRLVRRSTADGNPGRRHHNAVATKRRVRVRSVHRGKCLRRLVRHERHRHHEGLVRRPVGHLSAPA
jgi:NNP family nitrate/nitrite transporter-like MFS transporter